MQIKISLDDGVPIYLQISSQIRYLVASGRLKPGQELPPIRALAEQLQVTPNTVARAYRELEQERTVEKRSTKGTFVADSVSPLATRHRLASLHGRIDQLLSESSQLGFTMDELFKQIQARIQVMERQSGTRAS